MRTEDPDKRRQEELHNAVSRLPVSMVVTNPRLPDNPIVFVNRTFERETYYSRDYAIGRNCRFLQGPETDPADVARLRAAIAAGEDLSLELTNYRADGSAFRNHLMIAPVHDPDGEIEAFIGIQKQIDADTPLTDPVDAQDVMLRELQHRVKNHLSMIVGMIRMQARQEVSRETFEALSHRVQSLAMLYEELSPVGVGNGDTKSVPAGAYMSRVVNTLGALDGRPSIRMNVQCEEMTLPVDQAARLGLLVTEFLTNALEHAFPDGREGVINVRFQRQSGGRARLVVEDDGVGMPEGSDWPAPPAAPTESRPDATNGGAVVAQGTKRASGMGGNLVLTLVDSMGAKIDVSNGLRGTVVTVDLEVPQG
ncbi:PAS domain-containing protein [Palleronia pelagia]|uniref:histidine kinase n=1 Tax=Palleronia pelagia TaxID=387096 RepID=A0A1H8AN34_9RHOB|nr:PAS domain-containing protein [Palleronia pelagia]SEM71963.1 PAS domain S-box-containing protein [Palleronia pelagia]